jgi:hypothetical protein
MALRALSLWLTRASIFRIAHPRKLTMRNEMTDAEKLQALQMAVALMGFDPNKLAQYVAAPGDDACKHILLSSLILDSAHLYEVDGGNVASWQDLLDSLRWSAGVPMSVSVSINLDPGPMEKKNDSAVNPRQSPGYPEK